MPKRLNDIQKEEITKRFLNGETLDFIANTFGYTKLTIYRHIKKSIGTESFNNLNKSIKSTGKKKVREEEIKIQNCSEEIKQENENFPENSIDILKALKPGLSGIGSIIFSKEEEILEDKEDPIFFYKNHIAPYKAKLEIWFSKNRNLFIYFMLIFLTFLVVISKKNNLPYYFYDLPEIPEKLKGYLN